MSAPEQPRPIFLPNPADWYPIDGTVRGWMLKCADECARFDAPGLKIAVEVPTERGTLLAYITVEIAQQLPRLN